MKNYPAINWTDGVKITKDHFLESHSHATEAVQDATTIGLNSYNYGLLKPKKDENTPLKIQVVTQTSERLAIQLIHCNAITKNGCRIEYNSDLYGGKHPEAVIEAKNIDVNSNLDFLLLVTVNPYVLVPVGEPDPESIPLHHPYALPKIDFQIISKSQFNVSFMDINFLIIGKIKWKNGAFILENNYIPPTARIMYHPELLNFQKKISSVLINIRNYSIIINQKNRHKFLNNKLASNTFNLCIKVMDFVSENLFKYTNISEEEPPIYLAESISVLGNYFSNELAILEEEDREKLLQYFYEWIDVKPSILESTIGDIISIDYDHTEIQETIQKIDFFMAIIERLWKKLSDLEYIGQRKDNIVVSEEKLTLKDTQKDKSWSIID